MVFLRAAAISAIRRPHEDIHSASELLLRSAGNTKDTHTSTLKRSINDTAMVKDGEAGQEAVRDDGGEQYVREHDVREQTVEECIRKVEQLGRKLSKFEAGCSMVKSLVLYSPHTPLPH